MADAVADILALDSLWLLVLGAALAGIVRGFTGFGTAMVFVPFAAQVLPPVWVIVTVIALDILGPAPAIPRALRDGRPRDVLRLGAGAAVGIPIGIFLLTRLDTEVFRYAVSAITALLLALLVSGLRYRGPVSRGVTFATGWIAGLLGGAVGVAGPPVILLYMARPLPVTVIRANILLFLVVGDILMLAVFAASGLLALQPLLLGLALMLPYMAAVWIGAQVFDPGRETVYRWAAYAIIAGSVINGLPVWT